jgi:hypothetical protein
LTLDGILARYSGGFGRGIPSKGTTEPIRDLALASILKPGWFVMTELRFPDLRRAAGLVLLGVLLLASGHAPAAGNFPSAFVVAGVPVDATAEDAVAAREAARTEGERIAFRRLLERLTAKADWGRLPSPSGPEISALVQDFEVSNERSSGVRYLASYTFRFNPTGVRRLLKAANLTVTELASKPVVLVPVLKTGETVRLWDDPNPWREAWSRTPGAGGLVPWVVPAGNAEDRQSFDPVAAQEARADALAALSARYGSGDVVIVTAIPSGGTPAVLDITISRYSPEGTPETETTEVTGAKLDAALYQAGVQAAMHEMEESWKKLTLTSSPAGEQDSTQEVVVPIRSAGDWAAVRERLAKVPVVRSTDLELMSRAEVRLRLRIRADDALLRVALAQQDLVLTPGKPYGVLQLHSRAAGGP